MSERLYRNLLSFYEGTIKGRKTFEYWKALEQSQWLPRAELERRQIESLRYLLIHAYQHCSYYRAEWDRLGLRPERIASMADFQSWPLISREQIRGHRAEMRANVPGLKMLAKATGGSSGVPLQFDLNLESHERRVAASFRGYNWAGAGPGTRQFYFWGIALGDRSWRLRMKDRLLDRVHRRLTVNSFAFNRERVDEVHRQMSRYRPEVIVAYTNPLYSLARALDEAGIRAYSPRSIVVGAEKIYPFQREVIERVFQAPVFETYGAREFMIIGGECDRHQGLHVTLENLVVEVLDDEGRATPPGEEGNVVVTDLTNLGMPFVRYVNGDRAVAGFLDCSCGRGLPLLRQVTGRQLDMIETPDGRCVPGEFFPHLIKDFPAVERFQVIHDRSGQVTIKLVLRGEFPEDERQRLDREFRKVLGSAMQIDVVTVPEIPLTRQGKLQVVVNRVARSPIAGGPPVLSHHD